MTTEILNQDYESYLEEVRKDVEQEIKEIALNGSYTTEDIKQLQELVEFISTLPICPYEANRINDLDQ